MKFIVDVPAFAIAKVLKGMSWQSLIFYHFLRLETLKKKTTGKWISRSSTDCQKKFTKNYRKHIDTLIKLGWIEENPRYKNDKNGFTKSYRLGYTYQHRHKKHSVPLLPRKWNLFAGKHKEDSSDQSSDYLKLIKERHDMLSFVGTARGKESIMLKAHLDQKRAGVKLTKTGRVNSSVLQRKKTARKHVRFGESGWMVNVDITGMVQQHLNKEIKDPKWNQWIRDDFINTLKKIMGLKGSRKRIKDTFMTAISRDVQAPPAIAIRSFLDQEFPDVMEHVDQLNKEDTTIQAQTQRMESKLITEFIKKHPKLQMIPAHDGVFCADIDAPSVQEALEFFLEENGVLPLTKMKCYNPESESVIEKLRKRTLVEIINSLG